MNKKTLLILIFSIFFIYFGIYVYIYCKVNYIQNNILIEYINNKYTDIDIDDLHISKKSISIYNDIYSFNVDYYDNNSVAKIYNNNGSYNVDLTIENYDYFDDNDDYEYEYEYDYDYDDNYEYEYNYNDEYNDDYNDEYNYDNYNYQYNEF